MVPPKPPQALPRMIPTDEIMSTMKKIVAELRSVRGSVTRTVQASTARFQNVIQPLIDVENRTQGEVGVIALLRYASPGQKAQNIVEGALRLWRECEAEFSASQDLFLLVKAVKTLSEPLDFEATKYLDSLIMDFKRCGHGLLDADQIALFQDTRNQVDDLKSEYNQNVRDEDGQMMFSLSELEGVPQQDLDRFRSGSDGLRTVQLRKADVNALLDHAKDPVTRKRIYVANERTVTQNIELFKKITVLRDKNARLLGYDSHAAFKLEERLAKNPEWVANLLDSLEDVLLPEARREMDALLELMRIDYPDDTDKMRPWDYRYYAKLAEEDLCVDLTKTSEFFPLESTFPAILELFASFLQLRFISIPPEAMKSCRWHEDVAVWSVWDSRASSDGQFIGYLYADLFARPHKYRGSQNVNLQCGYRRDDGTRVYPATVLMCSFPQPTSSGCALLKRHELVTLFHELGHCIHDLVARTASVKFHGHRVARDFVEAPAILLENWCWMKPQLKRISRHYTTLDPRYLEIWKSQHMGEPVPPEEIPDEMLNGILQARNLNRALWFTRQLLFARFDMSVYHTKSHDECKKLDIAGIYYELEEKLRFLHIPAPEDRGYPQADFGHIVSGYDAGYYSYLSAHVFAADLFETAFADISRSQESWERYRREILEYGGSRDALQLLVDFLGHAPNPEVLIHSFHRAI